VKRKKRVGAGAYKNDGVSGRQGEDVGAGDDSGTSFLDSILGNIDQIHAVQSVLIGCYIHLRRVLCRALDQDRGVASLHHPSNQMREKPPREKYTLEKPIAPIDRQTQPRESKDSQTQIFS